MKRIIGHEPNKVRFSKALSRGRLPSTFLFVGPSGIGKRTFAIALARCLLCEQTPPDQLVACGACEGCIMVDSGNHPDLATVSKPEDKSQLLIEQFIGDLKHRNRAGLCYDLSLKPIRGTRKVAVIDDADYFGNESANCLLKILEEPPPHSVLIMIGTNVDRLLPTIRSRSQIFHFAPLAEEELLEVLQQMELPELPLPLEEIATECEGTLEGLKPFLDEGLFEFRTQLYQALASLEPMAKGFPRELAGFIDQAGKNEARRRRERFTQLTLFAIDFYRSVYRRLCGLEFSMPRSLQSAVDQAVKHWKADAEAATDCIERCLDTQQQIEANANQTTLVESWLSDLGKLSRGEEIYVNAQAMWSY